MVSVLYKRGKEEKKRRQCEQTRNIERPSEQKPAANGKQASISAVSLIKKKQIRTNYWRIEKTKTKTCPGRRRDP